MEQSKDESVLSYPNDVNVSEQFGDTESEVNCDDPSARLNDEGRVDVQSSPYLFENIIHITSALKDFCDDDGVYYFNKGCKWAPDGTCILSNSDDNILRIFDLPQELHCQERWDCNRQLPEMKSVLKIQEGRSIYDYCWYPRMSSWNPLSCCLVSTSQFSPVHMWDAFTGELRCTYSVYNHLDELEPAMSVAFDPSGEKLYTGLNSKVCVFRTCVPGRQCEVRSLKGDRVNADKQHGLVGCISINPVMSSIYAVGSYAKSVGVYCEPEGTMLCLLQGHTGGVTHLEFSPDGTRLYSGGRKDTEILCWDMRYPGTVLFTANRTVNTNQRVYFNLNNDGKFLVSGTTEGNVVVFDTTATPQVTAGDPLLPQCNVFQVHRDAVTGVSVHQQYPILATSSGQRHFPQPVDDTEVEDDDADPTPLLDRSAITQENCLKLWWIGKHSL